MRRVGSLEGDLVAARQKRGRPQLVVGRERADLHPLDRLDHHPGGVRVGPRVASRVRRDAQQQAVGRLALRRSRSSPPSPRAGCGSDAARPIRRRRTRQATRPRSPRCARGRRRNAARAELRLTAADPCRRSSGSSSVAAAVTGCARMPASPAATSAARRDARPRCRPDTERRRTGVAELLEQRRRRAERAATGGRIGNASPSSAPCKASTSRRRTARASSSRCGTAAAVSA